MDKRLPGLDLDALRSFVTGMELSLIHISASMNAILNELPLHVGYCAQWGISEPEMAAQPEALSLIHIS